jgi:hypothetical protein
MQDGLIKVVTAIDEMPAAKAGILSNDIITKLNDEEVQSITLKQAVEKLRGPVNTKINLTIMREGQDKPIEVSITREVIRVPSYASRDTPADSDASKCRETPESPQPAFLPSARRGAAVPERPRPRTPYSSPRPVLPGESAAEFEKLHRGLIADFNADGALEEDIVADLAARATMTSRAQRGWKSWSPLSLELGKGACDLTNQSSLWRGLASRSTPNCWRICSTRCRHWLTRASRRPWMIAGSRKPFFVSPSRAGSRSRSAFKTRSAKPVDLAGTRSPAHRYCAEWRSTFQPWSCAPRPRRPHLHRPAPGLFPPGLGALYDTVDRRHPAGRRGQLQNGVDVPTYPSSNPFG